MSLCVYWQLAVRQVICLTCIKWSLFTASPLHRGRMWTLITLILWHTWKCTSCALSTCQFNSQSPLAPSLFFLPHLFVLFLAVCAVIGRSFVIQQIPSSNLFMVVVDNKCDCSMFEPITMEPIEIMYILHRSKTGIKITISLDCVSLTVKYILFHLMCSRVTIRPL